MKELHANQTHFVPAGDAPHQRGLVQNRLQNFGLTMVVMGASFGLYYLGLFGSVPGPLEPARIGDQLAALGFSDRHLLVTFLVFLVISISWNWLYNAVIRLRGRHMTCAFRKDGETAFCSELISKEKSDFSAGRYVCSAGHKCSKVHIQVVKKGTVSHFLWMMWLVFSAMVVYLLILNK